MNARLSQSARQRAFFSASFGQIASRGATVAGRRQLRSDAQSPERAVTSRTLAPLSRDVALMPRASVPAGMFVVLALAAGALGAWAGSGVGGGL